MKSSEIGQNRWEMDYSTSALEQFVEHSKTLLYVECDKRWNMISHNAYLQELAVGAIEDDFTSMLLPESKEQLLRQKHDGKLILQFSNRHKGAVAVECTLFFEKDRRVIIGERPQLVNIDILNSMSKMQNELVNLTRDLKKRMLPLKKHRTLFELLGG